MSIQTLTPAKLSAWNDFVFTHPDATFFHRAEWKTIIETCFGFECPYLYEEQNNQITSILPLSHVRRPFFGNALISSPLCVYGGGVGDSLALEKNAIEKAENLSAGYLELRNQKPSEMDFYTDTRFHTFIKTISGDQEKNLMSIPRKQRAEVRKAVKNGLTVKIEHHIDHFYPLYAESVRNLGTPVFAKKYAQALLDMFGKDCEVMTVFSENTPLCSVLSFYFKDQVLPYYAGASPESRRHSAYPFMYYALMNHAAARGAKVFDFGRSPQNSGAYDFKKNFGFDPTPLHYQYKLIAAKSLPDMSADNPRNKIITSIWKKLPLALTNRLGPYLYPTIV